MRDLSAELYDFLNSIDMNPAQTDVNVFMRAFLDEMNAGLAGGPSSLRMLPTGLSVGGTPADGEPVIAIDAGGTNLRVALVEFSSGRMSILHEKKSRMPGSRGELSAGDFFSALADEVLPFTRQSSRIGFCFSYPIETRPDGDGEIICLTKELRVRGIEGCVIGQELIRALHERGVSGPFSLCLLNDTTAGLLGGASQLGLDTVGGIAGLVLGTGCNSCYLERGARIKKLSGAKDMIVNCESGNFARAFRGRADERVDAMSDLPGAYLFEKMLSGAYLGRVVTQEAALAAERGLLSPGFAAATPEFTTRELDELLRGNDGRFAPLCVGTDREVLCRLTESAFARAAKLVCANVLALCLHCDGGLSEQQPFTVVAEGSTLYNSLLLRKKLDACVTEYALRDCGRHIVFRRVENATLAGAGFAALTR